MRRGKPEVLVAILVVAVLIWNVWYARSVSEDLSAEATHSTEMFVRVYRAIGDPSPGAADLALADLLASIRTSGVPLIWTDSKGVPQGHANLPFGRDAEVSKDDPRVKEYVAVLARQHAPIADSIVGKIYYGDPPIVKGLRVIPLLQAITAAILLLAGFYILRTRHDAARERVWAGMARESAHQLGTPLSSLAGWVELLEERASDGSTHAAVSHMRGDLDRLDRVAHRFERIGREPKLVPVNIAEIVERITKYFQARVPTLANTIVIESEIAPKLPSIHGDPVLLEWAVEVLTKNAIDALAGRGGRIRVAVDVAEGDGVVVSVTDDGPGVPRELRSRIFEPGFSTKKSGWGIGLSLTKRIVEENHEGRLVLANTEQGARFEIILH
jgi:signal transduction histidine kinase